MGEDDARERVRRALAHARDADERFGPLWLLAHCVAREPVRPVLAAREREEEQEELFVRRTLRSVREAICCLEPTAGRLRRAWRLPEVG